MKTFCPIDTGRLVLRSTTFEDAPALFSIGRREETAYWAGMEPWKSVEDAREAISWPLFLDDVLEFGIVEKQSGRLVGMIDADIETEDGTTTATLGYILSPDVTRRGYMSEGVGAVCRCLFDSFGVDRIKCEIRPDNIPSRGVARKCGFVQNPHQKFWRINYYGKPLDEFFLEKTDETCRKCAS